MEKQRNKMLICEFYGKAEDGRFLVRAWRDEGTPVVIKIIGLYKGELRIRICDKVLLDSVAEVLEGILEYSEVMGVDSIKLEYRGISWKVDAHTPLDQIKRLLETEVVVSSLEGFYN